MSVLRYSPPEKIGSSLQYIFVIDVSPFHHAIKKSLMQCGMMYTALLG